MDYNSQKKVEKSEKFKQSVAKAFAQMEQDENVSSFGVTGDMNGESPDLEIPRDRFVIISRTEDNVVGDRILDEIANLQIKKAILERTKRKWEFVWRGLKISAPVLDESFYNEFFAHKIRIAPGDELEVILRIYQVRDLDTSIFINKKYEVVEVRKHIPRSSQMEIAAQ